MKTLIRQLIEALHDSSKCPRLIVNASHEGVEVPSAVKTKWGDAMPIDLDPTYPLDLKMEDDGVRCCLSFGGVVDCHFPWESIYVVQDRDTQLGMVIEAHLPTSWHVEQRDSGPVLVGPARLGSGMGSNDTRPERKRAALRVVPDRNGTDVAPEPEVDESNGEAVKRRAGFKVIEGGRV